MKTTAAKTNETIYPMHRNCSLLTIVYTAIRMRLSAMSLFHLISK